MYASVCSHLDEQLNDANAFSIQTFKRLLKQYLTTECVVNWHHTHETKGSQGGNGRRELRISLLIMFGHLVHACAGSGSVSGEIHLHTSIVAATQ
jgi:hypothetical protein